MITAVNIVSPKLVNITITAFSHDVRSANLVVSPNQDPLIADPSSARACTATS